MRYQVIALALVSSLAQADVIESEHHAFRVVTLVEGLAHPWSVAFLPGGDWLVTERSGRLRHVRGGELLDAPVDGTPDVSTSGQGGYLLVDARDGRLVRLEPVVNPPVVNP